MKLNNLIIITFLIISACSSHEDSNPILAKIDGEPIYLNDFMHKYNAFLQTTGIEDNLLFRAKFLDGDIDREILLEKAASMDVLALPQIQKEVRIIKNQIMLNHFNEKEIFDKIAIQDSDLRAAFQQSKTQIHARHLFSKSIEGANQLKQKLENGESFESLAELVFQDSVLNSNGGDIGYFTFNEMDPNFEVAAFSLKDGEISAPVKTKNGYSIIQVIDRWIEPLITEQDYQLHKEGFVQILKSRKRRNAVTEYTQSIKDNLGLKLTANQLQSILHNLSSIANGNLEKVKDYPEFDVITQISEISEKQRARVNSIEDLSDLLLGIKVRNEILNRVNECDWFSQIEIQNEIQSKTDDALLSHVVELLIHNEDLTENKFQVLMENLRKNKIININNELLKRFVLA
ncbi:MAG: hypothetical protein HN820_00805 [Candidatus Marinimicrobia bacterium]|nr:hypothetical protein [Candidatus Neomarinimicrobiota bacterium]MBT7376675.1 hypothetical protein [Candidatus Neomarinimicrobiota bacterium]